MIQRVAVVVAAAALCLAGSLVSPVSAQVFLASEPHPRFTIGPLFAVTNVTPDLSSVVTISFSLTFRPSVPPEDIQGDLYLLWPAEVSEPNLPGAADPTLAPELERRGFAVLSSGRVALRSRDRMVVGTGAPGEPIGEGASYVTFNRRTPAAAQLGGATFIKIPWTTKLVDSLHVVSLVLPLRGLIVPKPATWVEETFWGRRWVLTTGFGDLGSPAQALYPFYFEQRDRAVSIAREFSQVVAIFADSAHLRIENVAPAAATRRPGRTRAGNEVVTLPINPLEATSAQNVKVEFSYFWGWIAWRPIVVSLVLLVLSNVAGAMMFGREVFTTMRARRRARLLSLKRRPPIPPDALPGLVAGLTYDEIVQRLGPPDEEHRQLVPNGRCALVYRDEQSSEAQELELVLDDGHVARVERRLRRWPAL